MLELFFLVPLMTLSGIFLVYHLEERRAHSRRRYAAIPVRVRNYRP